MQCMDYHWRRLERQAPPRSVSREIGFVLWATRVVEVSGEIPSPKQMSVERGDRNIVGRGFDAASSTKGTDKRARLVAQPGCNVNAKIVSALDSVSLMGLKGFDSDRKKSTHSGMTSTLIAVKTLVADNDNYIGAYAVAA